MKLNTVIIEDCEDTRFVLRKILSEIPSINVIGEADNGDDGLSLIMDKKPDIVFLDIQMPGINGVEIAKRTAELNKVSDSKTYIIFATAFIDFAVDAFEYYAIDYLVKPYNLARIETAVNKVIDRFISNQGRPEKKIIIKTTDNGINLIKHDEICFITKEGRWTYIYTTSNKIKVSETLESLEKNLEDSPFKRCHKGFIANLKRIREIRPAGNTCYSLLMDGTDKTVLMSKKCFKEIMGLLGWVS